MSLPVVIEQYLDRHHLAAGQHEHQAAFTAHQLAEAEHVPDAMVAKVVFFFLDDQLVMGVLPANRNLNLHQVKNASGAAHARLASEREIAERISGVELGAIPPFGSLFGLPVFVDQAFPESGEVIIPGGLHTQSLALRMEDYIREESPRIVPLSRGPIHFSRRPRRSDEFDYMDY
jgi:Ala-tRNA(Pro) deacylase